MEFPAGSDHGLPEPDEYVTVTVAERMDAPSGMDEVSNE
jgi:hypothetical protein